MKAKWLAWTVIPSLALLIGAWIGSQMRPSEVTAAPNVPADVCPVGRVLTGRVLDCLGNPVAGALVEIPGWSFSTSFTSGDGFYTLDISALPVSKYTICATHPRGGTFCIDPPLDIDFWQQCLTSNLQMDLEASVCAQPSILEGVVLDLVGNPVKGATVEIEGWPNQGITGSQGQYVIDISNMPVVDGRSVTASYPGGITVSQSVEEEYWCPCTLGRAQVNFSGVYALPFIVPPVPTPTGTPPTSTPTPTLTPGPTPTPPSFLCPAGRTLRGVVRDYLGNPVEGATVQILGWRASPVTTDANGVYTMTIAGLPISTYTVVATLPSGEVIQQTRGISFWSGCRSASLTLDLQECLVTGIVYNCEGRPVEDGTKVEIMGWQTPLGSPYPNPALTVGGAYTISISSLPPGNYTIVARRPNGLSVQQTLAPINCPITQLNFAGLSCLPTDVCPTPRLLTGVVRNYLGQPVQPEDGLTVQILGWPITATVGPGGVYTIPISGLPVSTYSVVARWRTGLAMRTELPDLWQGCLRDLPLGNLSLDLEERLLTGFVYDCSGQPVTTGTVEFVDLQTFPGDPHPNPASIQNGVYTITVSYPLPLPPDVPSPYQLPDTPYQIIASQPGGTSRQQELAALSGLVTQLNFTGEFCLPGIPPTPTPIPGQCKTGATLSGEVRDCQGNPVSNATVQIEGTDRTATTNAQGRYVINIEGLPIQRYSVRASKERFADQVQTPPLSFWATCQIANLSLDFTGAFCIATLKAYVPVLNLVDRHAGYDTWIEVQNVGQCATTVSMDLYGEYTADCEDSNSLRTLHSGQIQPGSTWVWTSDSAPKEFLNARSAIVYANQPIAVEVLRRGPGFPDDSVEVTGGYAGIPSTLLGTKDDVFGGFAYYAPIVYGFSGGLSSWLYIQNAGTKCTTLEIYFKSEESCNRPVIGYVRTLAPGQMVPFDVAAIVGGKFQGSAWISASQPLAIAVDHVGDNILMSYIAMPAELSYVFNEPPYYTAGSQVNYGPLIYREYQGWDTTVHVQNLSSISQAKVKVYFLDASGDVLQTIVDWVCPRGSQHFYLPVINSLPGNFVGAVRVESQDWWSPGDPPMPYPAVVSVAELVKYEGPARTQRLEAIAYNLFTEGTAYDWQAGEFGVKRVGIPSVIKGRGDLTSEIAVQNLVPLPGFTDLALFMHDASRLLDVHYEKLNAKQVEYINVNDWALIPYNFEGSMIISATRWTHTVPGQPFTTTAGIAAISILRSGTTLGQDIPGDESAGIEAFPVLALAPSCAPTTDIGITSLQCSGSDETVQIVNVGAAAHDLTNWSILSVVGNQRYTFPTGYVLDPGALVRVHSGPNAIDAPPTELLWTRDYIWNDDGDEAELRDPSDRLVDSRCCAAGCAVPATH